MTLFSLQENGAEILIVSFSAIEIKENDIVSVTGNVKEYKGELEVVATEIVSTSAP
jgi:DNA/RNA endonuclease YhcR with UshA esterase domain